MHKDLSNPEYTAWAAFLNRAGVMWGPGVTQTYQLVRLRNTVADALALPGYRRLYPKALNPYQLRFADFAALPTVDKALMRQDVDAYTRRTPDAQYITTGGSTGEPFGFYRTPKAFARELASKAHLYHRIGWKEGDRQLTLRGLVVNEQNHMEYAPDLEELRCSSYHLTPEHMAVYYAEALKYGPEWIRAYPSALALFARYLVENKRRLPSVRGILCASENLYDAQKALFAEAFPGARVFSHYGHYECAALAGYCEHADTHHVLPLYGYVELLDETGAPVTGLGQVGEIVATSFIMNATLFVRYRTGDLAEYGGQECEACGRKTLILRQIVGRQQEFLVTATGRLISMTAINMHDDTFDAATRYQFYQDQVGVVELRYEPAPSCDDAAVERMRAGLMQKLGNDVQLALTPVEKIEPTPRGKHRVIDQRLDLHFAHGR